MHFPLWQYLNQPLGDRVYPTVFNPFRFWQCYKVSYLNRCLNNAFLEHCWTVSYQDFVTYYYAFCDRNALEEDPLWLLERCWRLERRSRSSAHPENLPSEIEP